MLVISPCLRDRWGIGRQGDVGLWIHGVHDLHTCRLTSVHGDVSRAPRVRTSREAVVCSDREHPGSVRNGTGSSSVAKGSHCCGIKAPGQRVRVDAWKAISVLEKETLVVRLCESPWI